MAVWLDVPIGDSVRVGNSVITVEDKSGRRARLKIETREGVSLERAGAPRPAPAALPPAQPPSPGGQFTLTRPKLNR